MDRVGSRAWKKGRTTWSLHEGIWGDEHVTAIVADT